MIDFLEDCHLLGKGTPPVGYTELVTLPRNGWPKSEQDRVSMAELHEVKRMLSLEATYTKREPIAKPD